MRQPLRNFTENTEPTEDWPRDISAQGQAEEKIEEWEKEVHHCIPPENESRA